MPEGRHFPVLVCKNKITYHTESEKNGKNSGCSIWYNESTVYQKGNYSSRMKTKKFVILIIMVMVLVLAGAGICIEYCLCRLDKNTVTTEDMNDFIDITKETFNIFINGIDKGGDLSVKGNSDVNVLVTVDPKCSRLLITTISRDAYIDLAENSEISTGGRDALWTTGQYGTKYTTKCMEQLFQTDIPFYVHTNFKGMKSIVNALGGVDVYSDETFTCDWGYSYQKGINLVNGRRALGFCRERHCFVDGDDQRAKNHRYMLEAIIKKAVKPASIKRYPQLLKTLEKNIQTNVSTRQIEKFAGKQLLQGNKWKMEWNSVRGAGTQKSGTISGKEIYVKEIEKDSLKNARKKIQNFLKEKE